MEAVNTDAAIAQQVERILGKDEVSSSNLDSSSTKALKTLRFQGFFLFLKNLNPVLKSHLATIWLLERVFFVFMPLWRGDFPAHPLLSGRSPSRYEHICSSWWRSARGRVCLILPAVQRLPQLFNDYNGTKSYNPPKTHKTPPQNCLQRGSFMSPNSQKA